MIRRFAIAAFALALGGCASRPPPPPTLQPVELFGTLDLSRPGVGIHIADEPGTISCDAHYDKGKLPETLSLSLTCADARTGTLDLVKAPDLRGTASLSDGLSGAVSFAQPPNVAVPPPVSPTVAPAPVSATYVRSRSSTGYVRGHYRRGTYVHGYYRNGHYVRGHARRGSYVHSYYRRRH